jgi:hypothetical protein
VGVGRDAGELLGSIARQPWASLTTHPRSLFRTVALVSSKALGETVSALQAALNPDYTMF